jgi:hypothetical protein
MERTVCNIHISSNYCTLQLEYSVGMNMTMVSLDHCRLLVLHTHLTIIYYHMIAYYCFLLVFS